MCAGITEKAKMIADGLSKLGLSGGAGFIDDLEESDKVKKKEKPVVSSEPLSSLSKVLMGEVGVVNGPYVPAELIGGCCPRVLGSEEDMVWNSAAEAVDSERIHIVWQAVGDKIWYLAVRSSELSSCAGTWCPFASLLPGLKDARKVPVCYTYYSDETATMMTLTEDGLQIHRGTVSVIRAKAERTVRELGDDVPIIELTPDLVEKLSPMPWYSLSLFEDRARRVLAALSVGGALSIVVVALFVWLLATMAAIGSKAELESVQERTRQKTEQLMQDVQNVRASPMREQLAKFAELNDNLLLLSGFLEFYQITDGKVLWRAIIPSNITSERISEVGGQTLDNTQEGVVIGNKKEALDVRRGNKK